MTPIRLRVFAFLLLLPLGLTLLPTLQLYRVHVSRDEQHELTLRAQQAQERLQSEVAAVAPRAEDRLTRDTEKLQELVAGNERLAEREVLAWLGFGVALAAFVVGCGLLLRIRRDSRRARASFETLLATLGPGWRAVSRGVLLHVALMFGAMVAMGLYEVSWSWSHFASVGWVPLVFLLPLWGAIIATCRLMLRSARSLGQLPPLSLELLGQVLPADVAPGLWRWVRQIAERVGAPTPDHVVVGLSQGFFATSTPVCMLPRRQELSGRTLHLPLTFLSVLSRDEAASIVGHELGHFAMQDTERGVQLSVTHRRMQQGIERLAAQQEEAPSLFNLPALWTSIVFLEQLDHAYFHFSREHELRADAIGARVEGPEACAAALLRVTALAEHVDRALEASQREAGVNAVDALVEALQVHPIELPEEILDHTLAHPIDTHPPTRMRIEALSVPLDAVLLQRAVRRPSASDTSWFQSLLDSPSRAA
ncbi:M48 family metallopeptidase [Nannocystis radixulma]|uniref:M48 family metallopeptidase n=1 Tax=Nannocystis radixulma TaxID=2995305 RepID=A0ABT5BMA5_9BACT|nr:M48 family metallopeptidase [Nannocystis radixulma]MDC0675305.1 M48 family metallopeptidase [Nannocystis radixulma]